MAKLTIIRDFGVVPNSVLRNQKLSLKAKGLFGYIQSKPDGWDFSADRIAKESSDGVDSVKSGLRELEENGYLKRKKYQLENGYWDYEYILGENPSTENPPKENPSTEKPSYKKEIESKKYIEIYNDIYTYWNSKEIITHKLLNDDIKKEIKHALRNYSVEEIKQAIDVFAVVLADSEKYWWTHKWGLAHFLKRGLARFVGTTPENYKKTGRQEQPKTVFIK